MFTGIVEEVGEITHIHELSKQAVQLSIKADKILTDIQLGDSIAVNGICLTVTTFNEQTFKVDVMPETIKTTSLASLKIGASVNLERSLQVQDRLGGHFVTGHVDGVGKIIRREPVANAVYYDIKVSKELIRYFIMKGSVAVEGVSLTIFEVKASDNIFTVSLIPHTVNVTVLGEKAVGEIVNIECDMLAKHVHHYVQMQK